MSEKKVRIPDAPKEDVEIKVQRNSLVPLMFDAATSKGFKIILTQEQMDEMVAIVGDNIEYEISGVWVPVAVHDLPQIPVED